MPRRGRTWETAHLAGLDRADPARFKQAIKATGKSYRHHAEQLGIPKSTLYTIGRGESLVSRDFARKIEAQLGAAVGALFASTSPASSSEEATEQPT